MTRGQYIALCIIGGVAVVAYLQSYQIAQALKRSGIMPQSPSLTA
jgi:hypothetical protein